MHCCLSDNPCDACSNTNDGGKCYKGLSIKQSWDPLKSIFQGWLDTFNKGELVQLAGPSDSFVADMINNKKGAAGDIRCRLMWGEESRKTISDFVGGAPPDGLLGSGEGADPGLFEVD
eukprot:gene30773-30154_t